MLNYLIFAYFPDKSVIECTRIEGRKGFEAEMTRTARLQRAIS